MSIFLKVLLWGTVVFFCLKNIWAIQKFRDYQARRHKANLCKGLVFNIAVPFWNIFSWLKRRSRWIYLF